MCVYVCPVRETKRYFNCRTLKCKKYQFIIIIIMIIIIIIIIIITIIIPYLRFEGEDQATFKKSERLLLSMYYINVDDQL